MNCSSLRLFLGETQGANHRQFIGEIQPVPITFALHRSAIYSNIPKYDSYLDR